MKTILISNRLFDILVKLTKTRKWSTERALQKVIEKGLATLNGQLSKKVEEEPPQRIISLIAPIIRKSNRKISSEIGIEEKEVRLARIHIARKLIRAHWLQKNDSEIGEMCGLSRMLIAILRNKMGLFRLRGAKGGKPNRRSKARKWLLKNRTLVIRQLRDGGKTTVDIIRDGKLNIGRERFRQICEECDIPTGHIVKTAKWYACRLGHPKLGDKEYFKKRLAQFRSYRNFASSVGIPRICLYNLALKHGLSTRIKRKVKNCKCAFCKKRFKRDESQCCRTKSGKLFCGKKCSAKWRWEIQGGFKRFSFGRRTLKNTAHRS